MTTSTNSPRNPNPPGKKRKSQDVENFKNESAIAILLLMAEKWQSTFVARSKIDKFSGGLLAPGTCANNDSAGTGIPGAFRVGRQIAYPVDSVIKYLVSRLGEI